MTILGLYLTWWQAREAANAAKAARSAVQRTQQQIRANQLMVLVPQLAWIASEVDWAIEEDNFRLVRRLLGNWRRHAGNIHGILMVHDPGEAGILRVLNKSISMAAVTDRQLFKNQKSTRDDCVKVREAMRAAIDQLNPWLGKNSTEALESGQVNDAS